MRIFLDECINRRLAARLAGHEVASAHSKRWLGLPDITVLRRCEGLFDVFVTADANLRFQQNLSHFSFGLIVLRTHTGSQDLDNVATAVLAVVAQTRPGETLEVEVP